MNELGIAVTLYLTMVIIMGVLALREWIVERRGR
jgi:hypothetical protein